MRATMILAGLLASGSAWAGVPDWSGDLALAYGRNWGQRLNVAQIAVEVKRNVDPRLSVGARIGGSLGAGVSEDSAKAYTGVPLLAKVEGYGGPEEQRPYLGLGLGVTMVNAAGAVVAVDGDTASASAYAVRGPIPTIMPEIGIDLGGLRLALQHTLLLGSANGVQASVESNGQVEVDRSYPGLGGTTLQVGFHFGRPRA